MAYIPTSIIPRLTNGSNTGPSNAQNQAQAQWDALMRNTPQQTIVPYDSAGVNRFIADFSRSVGQINDTPTNFSPSGQSSWMGVNYGNVDPTQAAQQAQSYNQANMGSYTRTASQLTEADTRARLNQFSEFNPSWRQEQDIASKTNISMMKGEVSKDVRDSIQRNSAYQSLMSGSYGGGNARALNARDLGRTTLDLQTQGQENSLKWQNMMGQLLPQITSAAAVMENQGLSTKDVLTTQLTNAQQQLAAQTANAAGMQQASEFNINAGQRAAELSSREGQANNALRIEAAARLMEAGTGAITNRYAADTAASNTLFANMWRPFIMTAERLGNVQGQTSSRPYGL
jgi:hypothetical protein